MRCRASYWADAARRWTQTGPKQKLHEVFKWVQCLRKVRKCCSAARDVDEFILMTHIWTCWAYQTDMDKKSNFQWSWSPHKTSSTICFVSTGNTYLHCWFTEDVTNDEDWKCVYVIYDSPDNRINPNVPFQTLRVRRPAERPNSGFETEKQRLIGSIFRNTAINTAMPIEKVHWLMFCWMLYNL